MLLNLRKRKKRKQNKIKTVKDNQDCKIKYKLMEIKITPPHLHRVTIYMKIKILFYFY